MVHDDGEQTVHNALDRVRDLVHDGRYHDAETATGMVIAMAPADPNVDVESMDDLQSKHDEFATVLERQRYVNDDKLLQIVDDIEGLVE